MNKILVVDDQIENLKLVANILKEKQYQMALAQSANEAMDILKSFRPDLILLDVMMPEIHGYDMCTQLKANESTADIPVIFITARKEEEDIVRGFEVGGVDYITKPFYKEELLSRIQNHLSLSNAYQTILNQKKELEEINKAKDQLFAVISHDMRTPLASMQLLLGQLLNNLQTLDNDRVRLYLKHIQVSSNDTFQLLDNLLSWSRTQLKSLKHSPVLFNVVDTIYKNINLLKFAAEKRNISIEFNQDAESEIIIFADEDMVKATIRNVLQNAIKFSYKDSAIKVRLRNDKDMLVVEIEDFGMGMDKAIYDKIMANQYYTTTGVDGEKGTGLGLSLVRQFVNINSGQFLINFDREAGILVQISLPRKRNISTN